MKRDEKGFSLPEVLLVLMIVALLLSLPSVASASHAKKVEERLFLEQLQSSITMIQNEAILNGRRTMMQTFPDNGYIEFSVIADPLSPLNHTLYLPETVALTGTSDEFRFEAGSGNLPNFKTVAFDIGGKNVDVVFQMGSGRYEIK